MELFNQQVTECELDLEDKQSQVSTIELCDLQLALVGGGIGDAQV